MGCCCPEPPAPASCSIKTLVNETSPGAGTTYNATLDLTSSNSYHIALTYSSTDFQNFSATDNESTVDLVAAPSTMKVKINANGTFREFSTSAYGDITIHFFYERYQIANLNRNWHAVRKGVIINTGGGDSGNIFSTHTYTTAQTPNGNFSVTTGNDGGSNLFVEQNYSAVEDAPIWGCLTAYSGHGCPITEMRWRASSVTVDYGTFPDPFNLPTLSITGLSSLEDADPVELTLDVPSPWTSSTALAGHMDEHHYWEQLALGYGGTGGWGTATPVPGEQQLARDASCTQTPPGTGFTATALVGRIPTGGLAGTFPGWLDGWMDPAFYSRSINIVRASDPASYIPTVPNSFVQDFTPLLFCSRNRYNGGVGDGTSPADYAKPVLDQFGQILYYEQPFPSLRLISEWGNLGGGSMTVEGSVNRTFEQDST